MRLSLILGAIIFVLSGFASTQAQEGRVTLELNKLEPASGACRAYMVLQNSSGISFSTLKLDLVLFDSDGIVARRLALETAPLTNGKTSLKVFDVADMACAQVDRVLLNDVLECADDSGPKQGCLAMIDVSGRGPHSLIK